MNTPIDKIPKDEVRRYLRLYGKQVPPEVDSLLDEMCAKTMEVIDPKAAAARFPIAFTPEGVEVVGTALVLEGKHIRKHLEGCSHCILLCATLGHGFDTALRTLQVRDMSRAIVMDSCGSAAIEEVLDQLQPSLGASTNRFSPGYGDLPLSIQPLFLKTVDAERAIGLTLSAGGSLIPRKSVTAILGVKA